jgi:hypothetical protein
MPRVVEYVQAQEGLRLVADPQCFLII